MRDDDRVLSRLDAEERWFGSARITVGTHSGKIHLEGGPLSNFELANAAEWCRYVLNGWDLPCDPFQVLAVLNRLNKKK